MRAGKRMLCGCKMFAIDDFTVRHHADGEHPCSAAFVKLVTQSYSQSCKAQLGAETHLLIELEAVSAKQHKPTRVMMLEKDSSHLSTLANIPA